MEGKKEIGEISDIQWSPYKKFSGGVIFIGFNPVKNTYHASCSDPRFCFNKGSMTSVTKQADLVIELYEKHMRETSNVPANQSTSGPV